MMRKLLFFIPLLVACGPGPNQKDYDNIRACTDRGGHAVFTSDKFGQPTYIDCEERNP